jgi:hypothetical protein
MTRKLPVRHRVKAHVRKGSKIRSYTRGHGKQHLYGEKTYVFRKRLPTKTVKLKMPWDSRLIPIDTPIAKSIKKVWKKGWRTSEACSSHVGEHIAPYVDFSNIPKISNPDVYKPLSEWFRKNKTELDLNYDWEVTDGSIFVVEPNGSRINDFDRPVSKTLHKELVNDLNKILTNLPERKQHD